MRIIFILAAMFFTINLCGQYSISGQVINELNEPLIGASVFLHGTDYATITDEKGRFVLENVDENEYRLKVSYVGFRSYKETIYVEEDWEDFEIIMQGAPLQVDEIEITANALDEQSAFSYSELDREAIEFKNIGQDLPFLVEHTPSMVVTSDAGAGIGYTGMRIRGSDATRINVTINGVPLNDSESHGVFWVNMPDFSSSVSNVQIQRGVGPSTNGAAAFGASVNLSTTDVHVNPYVTFAGGIGSFGTQKLNVQIGTGLMNNMFTIDGRYSIIKSDGYIDRAFADLNSWSFSLAKLGDNHSIRFNAFSGNEVTYQAWNGVPESKLKGSMQDLLDHIDINPNGDINNQQDSINLVDSGRNYNAYLYDNQVDDYQQDHYQLIYNQAFSDNFNLNTTLHYTRGIGFFESYKYDRDLSEFFVEEVKDTMGNVLVSDDVVIRKWLDNHFYGIIVNGDYSITPKSNVIVGGAYNIYDGDHYGRVPGVVSSRVYDFARKYYDNNGNKKDANVYLKWNQNISDKWNLFADIQWRNITYRVLGDDEGVPLDIDESYSFVNPKVGISYNLSDNSMLYASYAIGQREPLRSDFIDAISTDIPRPEKLNDIELGWRKKGDRWQLESNLYAMLYKDQLVLTGGVNDVGSPLRTNVDKSSRLGLELALQYQFTDKLSWSPNLTLSRNKINNYTQVIIDYFNGVEIRNEFEDTDIAFSPSVISGSQLTYMVNKDFRVDWMSKYVGKQYLDNTSSDAKSLDPYWVNDLVLTYNITADFIQNANVKLAVNNFLNHEYESNGYTYTYDYIDRVVATYLYPQASINFLLGLEVTF